MCQWVYLIDSSFLIFPRTEERLFSVSYAFFAQSYKAMDAGELNYCDCSQYIQEILRSKQRRPSKQREYFHKTQVL